MPRGKKKVQAEIEAELNKRSRSEPTPSEATTRAEAPTIPACNHRNMHYTEGELTCILPKGHGGDHVGYVGTNPTAWSDAAGTPTRKHA
jgi:hypothetical protein